MRNSFFGNSKTMKKIKKSEKTTVFAINWILVITLVTLSLVTGCPNKVSGESGKTKIVPITHGKAIITLDPVYRFYVHIKTSDGTPITVEGADKTSIESDKQTYLTATGTKIVLKNAKITYLYYSGRNISAVDVQELSALEHLSCSGGQLKNLDIKNLTKLRWLDCRSNNLDASAFTAILNALPKRLPSDNAVCYLFTNVNVSSKKNYQFTAPVPKELKEAFYKAKKNNWAIKKYDSMNNIQDIVLPQDESAVSVTGVALNKTELSLTIGESGKLTATVVPLNATNKTVSWASNKPEIVRVDQNGNLIAKKYGEAEITVTTQDGGFTTKCTVTVEQKAVAVTGVTLDNTALSLIKGAAGKLTATVAPLNATNKTVSWASNKPEIASVDQNGNLIANKDGEAEITVTTQDGGFTAKCIVTVEQKAVLTLSPYEKDIKLTAKTKDGTPITVEGCNVTSLLSGTETTLNATGEQIILKGDITELLCSENDLTAIDVSGLTSLKKLECQKNEFTELNMSGCVSLQELDCHENEMLRNLNLQGCTYLQKLYCNENYRLTEFNLQGCTSLQEVNCSSNNLTKLNVSGLSSLEKLDCSFNHLTELNVQGCISLKELDCNRNRDNLTKLDVSGLSSLEKLDCSFNNLTKLDVSGLSSLEKLDCSFNNLTKLDVSGLISLQYLDCSKNKLESIIANGLTSLQKLYCGKNFLTGITVQGCTALEVLVCNENRSLKVLNAKDCSSLQSLDCAEVGLTKLNLQGCTSLYSLNCYDNKLNKEAFTKIFAYLPNRNGKTNGSCCLYTQKKYDYNYKSFTNEELNVIKSKNWIPYKINDRGQYEEL